MAIQTGLEGKPWYVSALAGLAFGAVIFFLGYWFFARPMKEEIQSKQAHLAELQAKIQEGRAAERQLPQFREEVRRLELQLDKLLRILPARRNTPELLRRIRSLTEQGNFDLIQFRPGNFVDKDFYSEWPIFIQLNGTYHNLGMFFDRVSHFSRIINVDDLQITALRRRGADAEHTIHATFTAKTFVYKELPPEPQGPQPGQPAAAKGAAQ